MKIGIGIAGTHGKTTTSSMIGMIFEHAGLNPTLAIGGEVCDIGVNAKLGSGEFMVAELDESDGSFERFHPSISVVTNADWDHVNQYPSFESVVEAFGRFLGNVKKGGCAILCGEDRGLSRLIELGRTDCSVVTYGWGSEWDWGASNVVHLQGGGVNFTVTHNGQSDEHMELSVSGDHNIMNALAARIVAYNAGISFDIVKSTLKEFKGAKRRLQLTGVFNDILRDLSKNYPMNRLVQGDVGSGKTVIAILAMLIAVERGQQAVLMAPTEILAEQHFNKCQSILTELGIT